MVEFTEQQCKLLSAARTGHLATADASAVPHVIPVCFAFDGRALYSVLDQKPKTAPLTALKRVRNILANHRVALVIDHYEEDWQRLWYVLVHGRALLLEAGTEQASAINLLRNKYHQYEQMDIDRNPVIKLEPARVVSWQGDGG